MARPRERRPRPQLRTPEEAAELDARYQELYEMVQRLAERRPCGDSPPPSFALRASEGPPPQRASLVGRKVRGVNWDLRA